MNPLDAAGTGSRIRAFLAVELDDGARAPLVREAAGLAALEPALRPTAPEAMHLTLAFLGSVEGARLESLALDLARRPLAAAAFTLTLRGLGAFPDPRRPRVVWAGVADAAEVADLAHRVRAVVSGAGIAIEDRGFRPHVTIGRLGGRRPAGRALCDAVVARVQLALAEVAVSEVVLFESQLGREGARHRPLGRFPLLRHRA